ncbi:hypothetical protein HanRHA438_Chr04g0153801 [Helianthus annuus]|nr:hypothetical protein HanHA300_Chr04g0118151 [Helianthus annuus]KAJ0586633.1 hypothetical protein HanIR_Chr04g0154051 [Helianthus annuus]KAJ0595341.1 hypothetical protein HanHA89_Chr04g0130311 [Helianthus annuus]KAJ0924918.1 hypothetical protein HanRHA438_Chr04g0153801 [Helianthus annuus]
MKDARTNNQDKWYLILSSFSSVIQILLNNTILHLIIGYLKSRVLFSGDGKNEKTYIFNKQLKRL